MKARTAAGLSQIELAEFFEMSRVTISRYETGHANPPGPVLRLWALRCGVPLNWLRYGDGPPQPEVVAATRSRRRRQPIPPDTSWYAARAA